MLITHNHWDHLEGFEDVLNVFRVPVGIGEEDAPAIEGKPTGGEPSTCRMAAVVDICGISLNAIDHTLATLTAQPASCWPTRTATRHLFSGDTLFPGRAGQV